MTEPKELGLNELAGLGISLAKTMLEEKGEVTMAFALATDANKELTMVSVRMPNSAEGKQVFAAALQKILGEAKADMYVLVSEAWMSKDISHGKPSTAKDRVEVLFAVGQSKTGFVECIFPMLRGEAGEFIGLGTMLEPHDEHRGRFANLLPPDVLQ